MHKPRILFDNILCKVSRSFFEKAVCQGLSLDGVIVASHNDTVQCDEIIVVLDPGKEDDCLSEVEMFCVGGCQPPLRPFVAVSFNKFQLLQLEAINPVLRTC